MNKNTQYREYIIEKIKFNRELSNKLNNSDWEELGYEDEMGYEDEIVMYDSIVDTLEEVLHTYDNIFGVDDTDDRLSFYNIEDAFDYYWDESRNPNGNYETEQSLIDGEFAFCEKMGFSIDEWMKLSYKQRVKESYEIK
jgi:hypothetical protein